MRTIKVILKSGEQINAIEAYTPEKFALVSFQCGSPKSNVLLKATDGKHIPKEQIKEVIGSGIDLKY